MKVISLTIATLASFAAASPVPEDDLIRPNPAIIRPISGVDGDVAKPPPWKRSEEIKEGPGRTPVYKRQTGSLPPTESGGAIHYPSPKRDENPDLYHIPGVGKRDENPDLYHTPPTVKRDENPDLYHVPPSGKRDDSPDDPDVYHNTYAKRDGQWKRE